MADRLVSLLDLSGQWTHRDRHQHHRFEILVPEHTAEIRIRFVWSPRDMGSEHEQNGLTLSLWGPTGFRGTAAHMQQDTTISESAASLGFLAGPIPAGAWSIIVSVAEILNDGADTGYVDWHLEASASLAGVPGEQRPPEAGASTTPKRPPPGDGPRWYRGDLHSHTVHSDGTITIQDRVRGAVERGQDFLAITDHNTISHHRELDGWPDAITPIRASEVTTFNGHLNCFGLTEVIDWRDASRGGGAAAIVERAHRQNALISINHASAFGDPWCGGCHWDFAQVDFSTIDAIEVWNGRWAIPETNNLGTLALWTELLDQGFRPTAVSGSDSHSAEEDDYVALPLNYVHADDRSEASILDGIRRGRVFLSSGPTVSFRARASDGVEVVLPGDELPADGRFDLTVDLERVEASATLWYSTSGSTIAIASCEPGSSHVVRAGLVADRWWRLELRRGSAANGDIIVLTNPVYVTAR